MVIISNELNQGLSGNEPRFPAETTFSPAQPPTEPDDFTSTRKKTLPQLDSLALTGYCYSLNFTRDISCCAPVAQLDRATGYEPVGRAFESLRVHHKLPIYIVSIANDGFHSGDGARTVHE